MFWRLLLPAFLACVCNSLANALWKLRFDKTPLSLRGVEDVIGLLRSPNIWGGGWGFTAVRCFFSFTCSQIINCQQLFQ